MSPQTEKATQSSTSDPQNAPLPEWKFVPSRKEEAFWAIINFLTKLLWVSMKLVAILVLFFVALIGALTWKK